MVTGKFFPFIGQLLPVCVKSGKFLPRTGVMSELCGKSLGNSGKKIPKKRKNIAVTRSPRATKEAKPRESGALQRRGTSSAAARF